MSFSFVFRGLQVQGCAAGRSQLCRADLNKALDLFPWEVLFLDLLEMLTFIYLNTKMLMGES